MKAAMVGRQESTFAGKREAGIRHGKFEFDHSRDYGHDFYMVISKGKLKARMLEYFREVESTGEPLIVTDHGREVLEVRPIHRPSTIRELLADYRSGSGAGVVSIPTKDILAPISAGEWEALKDQDES